MARRSKKSSLSPGLVLGLLAAVAVFVTVTLVLNRQAEPFRTTDTLAVSSYLENANSLRGNVYRLDGEILNSLAMSPASGRLISVQPEENSVLPLVIPPQFNHINIQRGQRFVFMVEVDERGLLQVKDMTKS
jgi:hypothetical protein